MHACQGSVHRDSLILTHTAMLRTCNLVGRQFYTSVILTPDDSIRLVHEALNPKDANAHQVFAFIENEWQHVGYVDRSAAEYLVNRTVASARIVSMGTFHATPMAVEVN